MNFLVVVTPPSIYHIWSPFIWKFTQPAWSWSFCASSLKTPWPGTVAYSIVKITSYLITITNWGWSLIFNPKALSSMITSPGSNVSCVVAPYWIWTCVTGSYINWGTLEQCPLPPYLCHIFCYVYYYWLFIATHHFCYGFGPPPPSFCHIYWHQRQPCCQIWVHL